MMHNWKTTTFLWPDKQQFVSVSFPCAVQYVQCQTDCVLQTALISLWHWLFSQNDPLSSLDCSQHPHGLSPPSPKDTLSSPRLKRLTFKTVIMSSLLFWPQCLHTVCCWERRTPTHCMKPIFKQDSHPSSAAEQGLLHSCDTEALRPHLNLDVLLSLFQWRLHQIDSPPETFL